MLLVGLTGGLFVAVVLWFSVTEHRYFRVRQRQTDNAKREDESSQSDYCFNQELSGTTLSLERLASYEGPFLEDGSDREVVDIAALLVRNTGNDEIIQCGIELYVNDICMYFFGERIPPNASVLLLESDGLPYCSDKIESCSGWQITDLDKRDLSGMLDVEERPMGTIVVSNQSCEILDDICIYYKSWLSPPDILIGGIAYCVEVPRLLPGENVFLYPKHFAYGYSKIVSLAEE